MSAFATTGYRGTSVATIADASGISEAYVFRLFRDKQGLFVAALRHCFDRIEDALRRGAASVGPTGSPEAVLDGMVTAYAALIAERDLLMLQVHALAACDDEVIRTELLRAQGDLVMCVKTRSGASDSAVQEFFARGQLCHLLTALGLVGAQPGHLPPQSGPWVELLTQGIRHAAPER